MAYVLKQEEAAEDYAGDQPDERSGGAMRKLTDLKNDAYDEHYYDFEVPVPDSPCPPNLVLMWRWKTREKAETYQDTICQQDIRTRTDTADCPHPLIVCTEEQLVGSHVGYAIHHKCLSDPIPPN